MTKATAVKQRRPNTGRLIEEVKRKTKGFKPIKSQKKINT